jgi:Helix-turn-helix domain
MDGPKRLSTQQAADWLGLPEATLRWYRHRGDRGPRSYCLGSRIFYDLVDLEMWTESQKAATARGGVQ